MVGVLIKGGALGSRAVKIRGESCENVYQDSS